ncbi:rCG21605 [Rattus norvegicus]|uniref:RCG21605 n=1 Tax=Rattus norvegicus TaxID=10116 RepID=A6J150_RAT|nr:rCG21605 [Rattus norvegicus]
MKTITKPRHLGYRQMSRYSCRVSAWAEKH